MSASRGASPTCAATCTTATATAGCWRRSGQAQDGRVLQHRVLPGHQAQRVRHRRRASRRCRAESPARPASAGGGKALRRGPGQRAGAQPGAASAFRRAARSIRIDHYLGKETVQNLMVFRFANLMIEPLWNRNYIDHVQITVAESDGVETRAGYYDQVGALRDMLQNHMMQLLTPGGHGAAAGARGRRAARREGQGAALDPPDPPPRAAFPRVPRPVRHRQRRRASRFLATRRSRGSRRARSPRPSSPPSF